MRFRHAIVIFLLCVLAAAAHARRPVPPESIVAGDEITWRMGNARMTAVIAEDEIALFPGNPGRSAAAVTRNAGRRLGRMVHEKPSLSIVKSDTRLRGAAHRTRVRNTRHDPSVGSSIAMASPVLYKNGIRADGAIAVPTGKVIVHLEPQISAADFASRHGVTISKTLSNSIIVADCIDGFDALDFARAIDTAPGVSCAYPDLWRLPNKRNDPYFADQWHLENTGQQGGTPGEDVKIVGAWNYSVGSTAVIAIVDDGLDIAHEDLTDNVLAGWGWNWTTLTSDPSPVAPDDAHGTSCGGVAAARGWNGKGVRGAAPFANLVGYNLLSNTSTVNEADALSKNTDHITIYSNSWGPSDEGFDLGALPPAVESSLAAGVTSGRGGKGNIYVFACGNGQADGDNSNFDGYSNSRYTIAVAAVTSDGFQSYYSESGANVIVAAPSNGGVDLGILTTDVTGAGAGYSPGDGSPNPDYTTTFGGTSSACPLVAGIIGLMVDANSNLTWRDVRYILQSTARKNDPASPDWVQNGAGYWVNHAYGFGVVNAESAVLAARQWVSGTVEQTYVSDPSSPGVTIPDNDPAGVSDVINVSGIPPDFKLEYVEVAFTSSDHPYWGDLQIDLTSPDGTVSRLATYNPNGAGDQWYSWRFGSARHLGESPNGNWTLTCVDKNAMEEGTLEDWQMTFYGSTSFGYQDTVYPTAPVLTAFAGATQTNPVAFTWAASSDVGSGLNSYIIEVDDDSRFWSTDYWGYVDAGSVDTTMGFPGGTWYWRVWALDGAQNYTVSSPDSDSFVISDFTIPSWSGVTVSPPDFMNGDPELVTALVDVSDSGGIASVLLDLSRFGLSESTAAVQINAVTWQADFTVPAGMDSGTHSFKIIARDFAGNEIETWAAVVIKSAANPLAKILESALSSDYVTIGGNYITIMPFVFSTSCTGLLYQYRMLGDSVWLAVESDRTNPETGPPFMGLQWKRPDTALDGTYEFRILGYQAGAGLEQSGIIVQAKLDSVSYTSWQESTLNSFSRIDDYDGDDTFFMNSDLFLSVPAAAVSETVQIRMRRYALLSSPELASTLTRVGPFVEFTRTDGLDTFADIVRLSIPITETTVYDNVGLYYYDGAAWRRVSNASIVDSRIVAEVAHFTLFVPCAGALPAETTLAGVIVYPNPYVPNDERAENGKPWTSTDQNSGVLFENLTTRVTIEIYNVAGNLVARMQKNDNEGRYRWDARGLDGREVASGMYIAVITSAGERAIRKIMIVR